LIEKTNKLVYPKFKTFKYVEVSGPATDEQREKKNNKQGCCQ